MAADWVGSSDDWQNFSKVSFVLILSGTLSSKLKFEQNCIPADRADRLHTIPALATDTLCCSIASSSACARAGVRALGNMRH